MANENDMDLSGQLDDLLATHAQLLKMCYDALDASASQEERDAVREAIKPKVAK